MSRRRGRLLLVAVLVLAAVAGAAAWYSVRRRRPTPAVPPEELRFPEIRTIAVQIALTECPEASSASVAGDTTNGLYRTAFERAGVYVGNVPSPDVVFAVGARTAWGGLLATETATNGVYAWLFDTRSLTVADFKRMLSAFDLPSVRLWTIAENDWMLTGRRAGDKPRLTAMLERFEREGGSQDDLVAALCTSLPELLAGYVGSRAEILPAFSGDLSAPLRPEFFISEEVPDFGWIDREDVDGDISDILIGDIHEAQLARRLVVEGNMLSREEGKSEEAFDKWSAALRRNSRDTMLLDRLHRLAVNAAAFERVGNVKAAAKCYETMVAVRPTDAAAMTRYGECLKALGENEIALKALRKSEELMK